MATRSGAPSATHYVQAASWARVTLLHAVNAFKTCSRSAQMAESSVQQNDAREHQQRGLQAPQRQNPTPRWRSTRPATTT
jgi:hypothetical protein